MDAEQPDNLTALAAHVEKLSAERAELRAIIRGLRRCTCSEIESRWTGRPLGASITDISPELWQRFLEAAK